MLEACNSLSENIHTSTNKKKPTNQLHIFTIVFHFCHILFLQDFLIHLFFPFHMFDHHLAKELLCHRSMTLEFTPSLMPETRLLYQHPFQAQNTPLQNSLPRLFFTWSFTWFGRTRVLPSRPWSQRTSIHK